MTESTADRGVLLDDMVCFNLHAAFRAMAAAYRQLLEPLGLTYPQYLVLGALWDGGDLTVGELVSRVQSDYGTITPLVKRLEVQGLVERRRMPSDERLVTVRLTPEGDALRVHVPRIYGAITERFGLTPERSAAALEVLRSLATAGDPAGAPARAE